MDFKKEIKELQDNFELLKEEVSYFSNRVNMGTLTSDDRECVLDDISYCRKVLNAMNAKIKNIVIIKKEKYNTIAKKKQI